jgi:hypothetical protein
MIKKIHLVLFLIITFFNGFNCNPVYYYSLKEYYLSISNQHFSIDYLSKINSVIKCDKWNDDFKYFYHSQITNKLLKINNNNKIDTHNHLIIGVNNKLKHIIITTEVNTDFEENVNLKNSIINDECNVTLPFLSKNHCIYFSLYEDITDLYKYNLPVLKRAIRLYPNYKIIMLGKDHGDSILKIVSIYLKEEYNIFTEYFYSFYSSDNLKKIGDEQVYNYISNSIYYKYRIVESNDFYSFNDDNFANVNIGFNNTYKICESTKILKCLDKIYPLEINC